MWTKGTFAGYEFQAKVFEEPSAHGIGGGRVSKLTVICDGYMVANYDCGWDVEPQNPAVVAYIVKWLER